MNNRESLLSFSGFLSFLSHKSGKQRSSLLVALCALLILLWVGLANAQDVVTEEVVTEEVISPEPQVQPEPQLQPQTKSDLKRPVPDICYKCHVKLKDSLALSHVHFPFKDGKCISCHDAHASTMKGLVREDINDLCLSCHNKIKKSLDEGYIHFALKRGVCTDCHYPHSGGNSFMLVKAQNDLCWDCHEPLKNQLNQSFVHVPFTEGACSSCHDAHASSQENQILKNPNTLCKACHAPACKAGDVSISAITGNMDCTSCHGGHASNTSGLLGPYGHTAFLTKTCGQCHNPIMPDAKITTIASGTDLCFKCHKKDPNKFRENDIHGSDEKGGCGMCHSYHASKRKNLTVKESVLCFKCHEKVEKSTALMEKALKHIRCTPVKDRQCFECHIPPHSNNPLYFRADEIETCARCHVQQHKVAHPMGTDVKDPRNGQPITCITCHSMHAAKAEFMLIYDRKRQLCIQCHKK